LESITSSQRFTRQRRQLAGAVWGRHSKKGRLLPMVPLSFKTNVDTARLLRDLEESVEGLFPSKSHTCDEDFDDFLTARGGREGLLLGSYLLIRWAKRDEPWLILMGIGRLLRLLQLWTLV